MYRYLSEKLAVFLKKLFECGVEAFPNARKPKAIKDI